MLKFNKLQIGEILSETSYYTVKKVNDDISIGNVGAILLDGNNNEIEIGKDYLENIISSAEQFTSEEKVNQTELIKTILTNARIATSIYFKKQDKKKTKKAYLNEIEIQAEAVREDFLNSGMSAVIKALSDPISKVIPGEMRLIKGYHHGTQDERGRITFVDMEDDNMVKAVDPRTIEYAIINNVKYILK